MSSIASEPRPARVGTWTIAACAVLLVLMAWQAWAAYWQCDDAFISFRYVWNAVHGHGLVFNQGEAVEGYTNFLWVLELVALQTLFGTKPEVASNVLSALYSVLSIACVIRMAWPPKSRPDRHFVLLGTLLLLATSHTWAVWATSGLETRQFTFFVLLGLLATSRGVGQPRRLLLASTAFALAELTRPEGLMIWCCAGAWLLFELWSTKRLSWKAVLAFAAPFVLVVGAHYLWRHAYYGDWVPNTYYAKHVRSWPEAGVRYFAAAVIECGVWFLLPLAVVGAWARFKQGDRTHLLSALVVGVHVAYLVNIGGDHFELRPLDFYWPLLFIPSTLGMWTVAQWIARRTGREVVVASAVVLLTLGTLFASAVQTAKALVTLRRESRVDAYRLIVELNRENSAWLYALPPIPLLLPAYNDMQRYMIPHGVGLAWREHERFWREEMASWSAFERARGQAVFPSDAVTTRVSTGVYGYYLADVTLIDILGLTDRFIAHQPVARTNEERVMAHDRKAELEYLDERGFNVLFHPVQSERWLALGQQNYALEIDEDAWAPFLTRKPAWFAQSQWGRPIWELAVIEEIGCFGAELPPQWTLAGAGFRVEPMPHAPVAIWPKRCELTRGLSSKDGADGVQRRGTARSGTFVARSSTLLEMRLCGRGPNAGVRVIDAAGAELARIVPIDHEYLLPHNLDLTPFSGRTLRLEAFDDDDASWVACAGLVVLEPRRWSGQ